MLSDRERLRYQRHLQLEGFGESAQKTLQESHVCIVGLGGLGCPASLYLAAAGVGRITLIDGDTVSLSNLQRQVLFCEEDLERNKADVAAEQLKARNADIEVTALASFLTVGLAQDVFPNVDIVLDCTDNFHTRYLINDLCHHHKTPWIYASVLGFAGQMALFTPGECCFRCLFPELAETPDCNQAGVLGAVPGNLGTLQALEAIKYLAGINAGADAVLLSFDGLSLTTRQVSLGVSPGCSLCNGSKRYTDFMNDYKNPADTGAVNELPAEELIAFIASESPVLVDVRSVDDHQSGNLGGLNIPLEQLAGRLGEIEHEHRVVLVYCQGGKRSRTAALLLQEHGVTAVLSLAGGFNGQQPGGIGS